MHLPKAAVGDLLAELQTQAVAAQQAQHDQQLLQVCDSPSLQHFNVHRPLHAEAHCMPAYSITAVYHLQHNFNQICIAVCLALDC